MTVERTLHVIDLLRRSVGDSRADELLSELDNGELPMGLENLCRRLDDEGVVLTADVYEALVDLCLRQQVDAVEWAHLRRDGGTGPA